ncbi:MAG: hypothetical protein HOJ14_12760 [Nitrospina sp.]|jgi:hypothetical protein|nr:hypothetical protein [Nitrospina sp.]
MKKLILFIIPIFLMSFSASSKFKDTAYAKTNAKDRIFIVSFDYNKTNSKEALQYAKSKANTTGKMTSVYFFHKNDKMPLSGFSSIKDLFKANYILYDSGIVDEWKYAYVKYRNGQYQFVDCTKEKGTGLCQGE